MRGRLGRISLFVSILVVAVFSAQLLAQVVAGSITGLVTDPTGAAVAGTTVQATNVATNVVTETETTVRGNYNFPNLPAGSYVLTVEQQGFQRATTGELVLYSGARVKIDFELVVGEVTVTVEVVSSTPLIQSTSTELGVVIEAQKVRELPLNGRDFTQLFSLQAGFGYERPDRGGINVNGVPSRGNNFLMDGVDISFGENNGIGIGAAGAGKQASAGSGQNIGVQINTVSIEALQEFKVTTGAYSAEYGRTLGSVVNLTTKSGTNTFHGTAFDFWRNDILDAAGFFPNSRNDEKSALRWNQYGVNLGGPIVPDKAFFFFNFEGAKIKAPAEVTGSVPSPFLMGQITNTDLFNFLDGLPKFNNTAIPGNPFLVQHARGEQLADDEKTFMWRIDATVGSHRLSGRANVNRQDFLTPIGPRVGSFRTFPVEFTNFTVSDYITISPTMGNEIRFGYNYNHLDRGHPDGRHKLGSPLTVGWIFGAGLSQTDEQGGIEFETTTYTIQDNFSWISGAHTLKTGFEFRYIDSIRLQSQQPFHLYNTPQDIIDDTYAGVEVVFGNPGSGFENFYNYAIYVQDDWKVSPRLQLNLGLRYEYYTVFKGPIGLQTTDVFGAQTGLREPIWGADRNNFAPRAGLIYDLTGKGNTILRAGGGISYLPAQPFDHYDMTWVGPPPAPFAPFLAPGDFPSDPTLNVPRFPLPVSFVLDIFEDPSKLPAGFKAGLDLPDPTRRDSYAQVWNLNIQHAFSNDFAVDFGYVGNRINNLFRMVQVNPLDPATDPPERIRPTLGRFRYQTYDGRNWYHAFQVSAKKRMSRYVGFDAYYTWAKGMSTTTGNRDGQDNSRLFLERGPVNTVVPHRFTLVNLFEIPYKFDSPVLNSFFSGWTLQGILGTRTGRPINVSQGTDVTKDGLRNDRPDGVSGIDPYLDGSEVTLFLNPAAFDGTTPGDADRIGTLGFNSLRGPSAFTWDALDQQVLQYK